MLKPSKLLMLAAVAAGLAAVAGGALYAAYAQGGSQLYVTSVEKWAVTKSPFAQEFYIAARVGIVDQANQPVSGARVTGIFSGCGKTEQSTDRTLDDGKAIIRGPIRKCGCAYTFTVTTVTKQGSTWDPPNPLPSGT